MLNDVKGRGGIKGLSMRLEHTLFDVEVTKSWLIKR